MKSKRRGGKGEGGVVREGGSMACRGNENCEGVWVGQARDLQGGRYEILENPEVQEQIRIPPPEMHRPVTRSHAERVD